ncbi:MAG: metallophosphoesterase family protein [Anaerolineae bacterium]|jgi:Icc-related predicted phosphoesterase|nr:metallophosphoesterase family protein [Anaerolineae bacterium]
MKLLLFSDLHTNRTAARSIVQQAAQVDVLVGAGDFANMRHGLGDCLSILRSVDKPIVLVAGNNETTDELLQACEGWESAYVLHGTGLTIEGVTFFGIGGGIPVTPFGPLSYDFSETQARELLKDCPSNCVLVSHSPPLGAVDSSSTRKNLGSVAMRETIERVKPRLVVCGHIHASAQQTAIIGETPVINAGPAGIVYTLN